MAEVVETVLEAPALLVAVPQLGDPNFHRGVVLLLEHGDEGSMGLLVNRPTDLDLSTFCASQNVSYQGDGSIPVFQGGPVQTDRAFILHAPSKRGPETQQVLEGVLLSYSLESLRLLSVNPPERLRVYLGYAGWGPGQLAEEVTAGAWLLVRPTGRMIFEVDPVRLWDSALAEMGIDPVQLMHSGAVH